jgi:hypothetical protein
MVLPTDVEDDRVAVAGAEVVDLVWESVELLLELLDLLLEVSSTT